MTTFGQEFRDAAGAACDISRVARRYPSKDRTQHPFFELDERVPGAVVGLGPRGIPAVDVEQFHVQGLTHRWLRAMGEHVGDGAKLLVRLYGIAERPSAQQTQASEADQKTFKFGLVLHPRTLVRGPISRPR